MVTVFCDGACSGNPGPGGWAFRIIGLPEGMVDMSGNGGPVTTNNRMELMAAISALERLADVPGPVEVKTDSNYVVQGMKSWLKGWKAKAWHKADGSAVINPELWKRLDALDSARTGARKVTWSWVKGHAGHEHNEAVDRMAVAAGKGVVATGEPVPMPTSPGAEAVPAWLAARADAFRQRLVTEGHDGAGGLVAAFDLAMAPPA